MLRYAWILCACVTIGNLCAVDPTIPDPAPPRPRIAAQPEQDAEETMNGLLHELRRAELQADRHEQTARRLILLDANAAQRNASISKKFRARAAEVRSELSAMEMQRYELDDLEKPE